jgi:hypothetical protein
MKKIELEMENEYNLIIVILLTSFLSIPMLLLGMPKFSNLLIGYEISLIVFTIYFNFHLRDEVKI